MTDPFVPQKNVHLYQLLRPELVKKSPTPLSSDAYSKLGKDKHQTEHNNEVKEATKILETVVIPGFAAYLDRRLDWVAEHFMIDFQRYSLANEVKKIDTGGLHLDRSLNSLSDKTPDSDALV